MTKEIPWLMELILNYQYRDRDGNLKLSRTPHQVDSLKRMYADVDAGIMLEAAVEYIKAKEYFPSPAQFNPFVQQAIENNRGTPIEDEGQGVYYGRWRSSHTVPVTDEELFEFESARGWR